MSDHIYDQRFPIRVEAIYTKNNKDLCIKSQDNKKMKVEVPLVLPNLVPGYLVLNEQRQIITSSGPLDQILERLDELAKKYLQLGHWLAAA